MLDAQWEWRIQRNVESSGGCVGESGGVLSQSQAYLLNATVVLLGSLGYQTLWPDGEQQPYVSTLNAYDGAISSNMAAVPAGNNSKIEAHANRTGTTNLILDISSYFGIKRIPRPPRPPPRPRPVSAMIGITADSGQAGKVRFHPGPSCRFLPAPTL